MLEEIIKQLDNKGLLVLQVLIGKRAIELLEEKPKAKKAIIHA